jgi:CDP-glucose 4,6-dehydratase
MEGHCSMAGLASAFWNGKRVFITGHTGFKGIWLSLWLQSLGATAFGYSTSSPDKTKTAISMESFQGDICDLEALHTAMRAAEPDIVLHMAAQPLVRRAFHDPIGTYKTNVIGTATLLESVRRCESVRAVIVVTTDKCYENRSWDWAYREVDRLGGNDPYSSSKACMELVVSSFRDSFFSDHQARIASARAGNVIGGGDWAEDRLIPDMMRSFAAGNPVTLRNPQAARPWQYVLEALRGYLLLAERLYEDGSRYSGAWNFGPASTDIRPVQWIAGKLAAAWGAEVKWNIQPGNLPQEAQMLRLDCSKAAAELGWHPVLDLSEALEMTVDWYRYFYEGRHSGKNLRTKYLEQIAAYSTRVAKHSELLPETSCKR